MIMVYLQALKERDPKRAVAEGESIRALAEGEAAAKKLQADADLYVRMKEAEGERGPWLCSLSTVYCHWSCKGGAAGSCQWCGQGNTRAVGGLDGLHPPQHCVATLRLRQGACCCALSRCAMPMHRSMPNLWQSHELLL